MPSGRPGQVPAALKFEVQCVFAVAVGILAKKELEATTTTISDEKRTAEITSEPLSLEREADAVGFAVHNEVR